MFFGLMWTMKLWDSMTTCLILLSAVHASPLFRSRQQSTSTKRRGRAAESPLELPPVPMHQSVTSPGKSRAEADTAGWEDALAGEKYFMEEPLLNEFDDVVDFIKVTISRVRRSSSFTASSSTSSSVTSSPSKENLSSRTRNKREKLFLSRQSGKGERGGARAGKTARKTRGGDGSSGRGQGCVLKQIHLNVSDLGLGYRSSEEMIFRYCSGPCRRSETNYDKILYSLTQSRRLPPGDIPPQVCCRPIAFDSDLSFLDDSLIYHTVKKHSARKCGCV